MLTSFLVTSTDDTTDSGTLRWAIQSANDSPGADTIEFDSSFSSPQAIILDGLQLPTFTGPTIISGPGADLLTISGADQVRVFQVAANTIVSIDGLTIADGFAPQVDSNNLGDAAGGGILNYGQLSLSNVTLTGNHADYYGGAIESTGLLTISDSTITQSTAIHGGAVRSLGVFIASHVEFSNNSGLYAGGAIFADGLSSLTYCTIEGNTTSESGTGGGIYQASSDKAIMTIDYSTIANNTTGGFGGGLYNVGQVTINSSTISGNSAFLGGGIFNWNRLHLDNSTIAENSVSTGGGGIANYGLMDIDTSTISANSATTYGGGILQTENGFPVLLSNTIVVANWADGETNNVAGSIDVSNSRNNLLGPGSRGFWVPTDDGSHNIFLDADGYIGLGPLADNGGPTRTMALLADSPAVDAGIIMFPGSGDYDQRGEGFDRLRGTYIDIGAFESTFVHGVAYVAEGATDVKYVVAYEPGFTPTNFSVSGGEDQDLFTIDPETGMLSFLSAPDYEHPLDANSDNLYQVEVTLSDAEGHTIVQPWTVEVTDNYEYDYVTTNYGPATYQVGEAPVQDSQAEFHAADEEQNYAGSKFVVSIIENRDKKDVLKVFSQGTGPGQISVKGKNVLFGGIVIGTVQGGSKAKPDLIVTFNSAASESAITALMKQVGFSTKNKRLPQSSRLLKMQVVDLPGGDSSWSTRQINVAGRT